MIVETTSEPVRDAATGKSVLFFDADCLFCSRSIRWLQRHDRDRALYFAPLRGGLASRVLAGTGLIESLTTMVLVTDCLTNTQKILTRSSAAVRVAALLPSPWRLGALGILLPRRLRDAAYDFVARHRHGLAGRDAGTECPLPSAEDRERFFA